MMRPAQHLLARLRAWWRGPEPRYPHVHFTRTGVAWVDPEHLRTSPKVARSFQDARRIVEASRHRRRWARRHARRRR